jgi:RND family efflux transporter MFP subunit
LEHRCQKLAAEVESGKAAVEKATLDLSYTRVTSPIDGLTGQTQVKPGNLVGRGESTLLTTISQLDPILFRVAATEADYLRIAKRQTAAGGAAARGTDIQLTLADGSLYAHTGRVNFVERAVDATTGTLGVELAFPNPDRLLRPGQYGRARLLLDTNTGALLIPQRAVQELQSIYTVAVVDAGNKVAFRTGESRPARRLAVGDRGRPQPGERVVTEGLQRIQDGMTVVVKAAPPEAPEPGAAQPAAKRSRLARRSSHGSLFCQPSHRCDRDVDHHRDARPRRDAGPAHRAVSRDRAADGPGPTTFISASATDVEASVATPLEQKINGVEKGIYIKSTNANDGTLTLKVSFEIGSNPDMDNVFTQNRVSRPCRRCRSRSRTTASR